MTEIYSKNLEAARKDIKLVSEQYASGRVSILDLMDAQVSVIESQTSLVKVRFARSMIESEIRRLIGQYDVLEF